SGRRVALDRGSATTLALAELLDRAGSVAYRDLDLELLPAEVARLALLDGHVDAWFDHTAQPAGAALHELPETAIATTEQTVWFARRDTPAPLIAALRDSIALDPCAAEPITRTFLTEQQRRADLLAGQGAIGLPVDLGACAQLTSAQPRPARARE
ncbi:MAG: hypothetical protein ACREJT_06820, partial [Myxococcota bacterium]